VRTYLRIKKEMLECRIQFFTFKRAVFLLLMSLALAQVCLWQVCSSQTDLHDTFSYYRTPKHVAVGVKSRNTNVKQTAVPGLINSMTTDAADMEKRPFFILLHKNNAMWERHKKGGKVCRCFIVYKIKSIRKISIMLEGKGSKQFEN
jgi:hypothetical protein